METQVGIFEGIKSLSMIYYGFLEKDDDRVVYGAPLAASKFFDDFLNKYHKVRVAKKKWLRHIYNSDAKKRVNFLRKLQFTKIKYLDKEFDSPVATSVCGDQVVLTLWSESPVLIVISNQQIADAYQKYFELLWKRAHS